ncbi:MAG: hypothetical protein IT258_06895 [Saprospiraceae bacterium]|nr:hypothetical protein [Saprospiraceae bacterium]
MKNPKTVSRLLFFTLFSLLFCSMHGQQVWQQGYPGTDAIEANVVPTPDGGFLFSCNGETVATKTDANGIQQWSFSLPDSLDGSYGGSVAVLPDGNYVVVGGAVVNNPSFKTYDFAAKLTPTGSLIWLKFYTGSGGFYGQTVAVAADGGLYIGNQYQSLMKTDANGNSLWKSAFFYVEELVATADGGAFLLVYDYLASDPNAYIYKVSSAGDILWVRTSTLPNNQGFVAKGMAGTNDGGFVITGVTTIVNNPGPYTDLVVQKYDAGGIQQWSQIFNTPNTQVGENIAQTQDGGYIVTGWQDGRYVWLWRLDAQGNQLWDKAYFNGEGMSVETLSDGGFIMLTRGLRLVRTDAQGNVFQNLIKGSLAEDLNQDCLYQAGEQGLAGWSVWANGPVSIWGVTNANGGFEIPVDTGDYVMSFWPPQDFHQPCQPGLTASLTTTPSTADLGFIPALAVDTAYSTISGIVFQDLDGDCEQDPGEPVLPGCIVWAATEGNWGNPQFIDTTDASGAYSFTLTSGTDYYWVQLAESSNPYCQSCNNDWLQFLSIDPITHNIGVQCNVPAPQHFTGFVFFDENENCQPDFGEPGLNNWTIDAVKMGTQDTFQILSTQFPSGYFTMLVDTGDYFLTIVPPNYLYLPCQFVYLVNVALGGSPTLYIPLMPLADCPKLRVDVGASLISPCFPATYFLQYCNDGTAPADDAYVQVTFPPALTVDSSQIPGVALPGNVWQYQLGDLPTDSCGSFWIKAFLDCADSVGWTYCVEAHIFPDSICGPSNPVWDGSSVELSADCVGDSVILTISNAGWGNMGQPLNYIVVEDNVLIRDSSFQLPAGGSTQVTVFPNGATIVLSAQQAANHPGMSMPLVFVEGCGGDSISLGFVTQYPQDDADCFLAIDCRESVAACDPNTKAAQPKGLTDAHFIENTTELSYQITFQNLGTASAQNVVILDTLSQFLDTSRLQLGVSSHPYEFELLPPNVLKFTFPNIQLPQASLDYDASIGFVKYRLPQRLGNQPGTEIHNRAGIYFDFNPPIITNTVTHRIPQPVIAENNEYQLCAGDLWNGQPITADTLLTEWQHFAFFDSVFTTWLDVLPTAMVEVDTTVAVGSVVFGVVVNADTSFTQVEITATHCIQHLVTAHILTDATPGLTNLRQFAIAPNPASGHLTLSGQLTKGAYCEATLMDAYGRTVVQCFENEWIAGGFSRRVDLQDVPSGLYFVCFALDGERQVRKVVVE